MGTRLLPSFAFALVCLGPGPAVAADFYVDPATGSAGGSGSAADPWATLEQVVADGHLAGTIAAGDTVWLRDGYHGTVVMSGVESASTLTIAAEGGHTPALARIEISDSTNITLRGLHISPEFAPEYSSEDLVVLNGSGLTIEDSTLYSVADASGWGVSEWNDLAANAIGLGGDNNAALRNDIRNVNFGISVSASDSRVEGNTIDGFAGDGLRGLGDRGLFEYNLVKNNVDVNDNHDDGFQSWSNGPGGVGSAEVTGIVLRGNVFINYEDPNQPLRGSLQGIGCFDGTFVDWVVENNIVIVDHWHGITQLGARNAKVVNNTVLAPPGNEIGPPWISVDDHKDGTPPEDCLVGNNLTTDLANASGVTDDTNMLIEDVDALFVDAAGFDVRLLMTAAAVDAANAAIAPPLDADGIPRAQGDGVDVGAYEWHEEDVAPTTGGNDDGGDSSGGADTTGATTTGTGTGNPETSGPPHGTTAEIDTDTDTDGSAGSDGTDNGCSCRARPEEGEEVWLLLLLGGLLVRRRRSQPNVFEDHIVSHSSGPGELVVGPHRPRNDGNP